MVRVVRETGGLFSDCSALPEGLMSTFHLRSGVRGERLGNTLMFSQHELKGFANT